MTRHTYTVAEAAELLGVSARHLYTLAARGDFQVIRLGGRVVVPKAFVGRLLGCCPEPELEGDTWT